LKRVKQNRGVKIPNARVWAGWDKGIYLKNRRLARKRAMRAGKKEGVLGEGIFARPPQFSAKFLPAAAGGGLKIGIGVFSVESSNFFQQTPH